eukprot:COSAG02_NODE_1179_length_14040_cov_8.036439_5_plen_782_part_00
MIRVTLLLMLHTRGACRSTEPQNASEDAVTPSEDALQVLQRDNDALRQRIAELQQRLDRCVHGHSELATGPAHVEHLSEHLQELPLGTYRSSCSECRMASQLVTCRCPQKASITSSTIATMPSNNLTGGWVIPFADGGRLAGKTQDYLRIEAELRSNPTDVVLTCGKLPLDPHYPASCRAPGQSEGYPDWNRGTGTRHSRNGVLAVRLDNGWHGCAQILESGEDKRSELHRQLRVTQLQWLNCTTFVPLQPTVQNWTRMADTGLLTSLWLPSCANYSGKNTSGGLKLSNSDGLLSCDWRIRPPPRVGNLSTRGFGDVAHTCRILSSYTFLAPQYKAPSDPLATYPLLNDSNKSIGEILEGSTWTSFTADRTLGGDTFELTAAAIGAAIPLAVADSSRYTVRCTAGGPDPSISCNPHRPQFDNRGTAGSWHTANLSINMVPSVAGIHAAEVDFVPGGALSSHSLSGTLTVDLRRIDWQSGERWVRIHPHQLEECCTRCRLYGKKCKGWVVQPAAGSCSLVSTTTTAYPSLVSIAGYPMHSDAASYCTSMFTEGGEGGPWADEHLAQGTTCGSIQARSSPSIAAGPTRGWSDSHGNMRGAAWLFYPGGEKVRALPQNLTDLWTSSSCSLGGGPCTPNNDILSVVSDPTLGTFTITCKAPGLFHHCTPSSGIPIRPNEWHTGMGLVDWATREITVHFDDDLVYTGTASADYNTIELHSVQGDLTLRRMAQCSCHCEDEPDCSTMNCVGPDLTTNLNSSFVSSHVRGQRCELSPTPISFCLLHVL